MKNLSLIAKIFLLITSISFPLWLGGYVARQVVIYQLFEPIELNFKTIYQNQNLSAVFYTIFPLLVFNLTSYSVFLISFTIFLITSKINLKKEGWLFIILIIILICAPFEIYLSITDYKIASIVLSDPMNVDTVTSLVKERMMILNSFPLIEIFSSFAIIYLFLFKPFRKENEN